MRLLIVCLAAVTASAFELGRDDLCALVDCRAGRECVVSGGVAECHCQSICPESFAPVCGSDGTSYDNHCRLHRHACLTGSPIRINHKGFCKKSKEVKPKKKIIDDDMPDVCYSSQRDAYLIVLGRHWQDTLPTQPWYVTGMTYRESLWGRFFSCDQDKDNHLDTDEMLNCTSGSLFMARPEQDKELTRTLCVDAIIDEADSNHDWRLDFEEFTTLLSPDFKPPQKQCSLEGNDYLDGDEVHVDGNHCVCAVGSWVCTSKKSSTTSKDDFKPQVFDYLDEYEDDADDYDDDDYYDYYDDDDLNKLFDDDEYEDEDDEDITKAEEAEEEEYINELFDDMLTKLKKYRKDHHHHNHL